MVEEPAGWDGVRFEVKRDNDTHGVFFSYTGKLKFRGAGKALIAAAYEAGGIGAEVKVRITRANAFGVIPSPAFYAFYNGVLAMDSLELNELFAVVSVEQSGFLQQFQAGVEQKVRLTDPTEVVLHSREIVFTGTYTEAPSDNRANAGLRGKQINYGADSTNENADLFDNSQNNGLNLNVALNVVFESNDDEIESFVRSDETLGPITFVQPCEVELEYTLSYEGEVFYPASIVRNGLTYFRAAPVASFIISPFVGLGLSNFNPPTDYFIDRMSGFVFNEGSYSKTQSYTRSFLAKTGDFVYTFGRIDLLGIDKAVYYPYRTADNANVWYYFVAYVVIKVDIKMRLKSYRPASTVKAHFVKQAFGQVIAQLTGANGAVESDYFDEELAASEKRVLCNGLNLRRLKDKVGNDYANFISFKELFDGLSAIDNLGVGIEKDSRGEYVRIEPMTYFYKDEVAPVAFDFVEGISGEVARDYYVNRVELGYNKWQIEGAAGLDEFNSVWEWYVEGQKKVRRSYTKKSNLIAGGYLIEKVRRYQFKPSTDTTYDNDTFIICVRENNSLWQAEKNESWETPYNVLAADTVYNWRLHPARSMIRHLPRLQPSGLGITFLKAEGNSFASSKSLDDNLESLLLVNNSRYKLWKEKFEVPLSWVDFLEIVYGDNGKNLYKKYNYSDGVNSKQGYILSINYQPAEGKAKVEVMVSYE